MYQPCVWRLEIRGKSSDANKVVGNYPRQIIVHVGKVIFHIFLQTKTEIEIKNSGLVYQRHSDAEWKKNVEDDLN